MTKEEFKVLAKSIRGVYGENVIRNQEAFDIWYDLLKDLDYKGASLALQRYMSTSKYPPSIADIREQYAKINSPEEMTDMEAWSLVSKAIRDSAYRSREHFDELPRNIQRAVGSAEQLHLWAIDEEYNEGVTRSNFLRSYRNVCEREREEAKIPESVRKVIKSTEEQLIGGTE